jgi:hypothetical protein
MSNPFALIIGFSFKNEIFKNTDYAFDKNARERFVQKSFQERSGRKSLRSRKSSDLVENSQKLEF